MSAKVLRMPVQETIWKKFSDEKPPHGSYIWVDDLMQILPALFVDYPGKNNTGLGSGWFIALPDNLDFQPNWKWHLAEHQS